MFARRARPALLPLLLSALPAQERLIGVVEPRASVALQAAVDARCDEVACKVGQRVQRGQELVRLRAPQLLAHLAGCEARSRLAEVALETTRIERRIADKHVAIAERQLKIAGESLEPAQEQLAATRDHVGRVQALYDSGRASSDQLQQARLEASRAAERWSTIGERVKNAQDEIEIARLEAERATLQVAAAEAELALVRAEVDGAAAQAQTLTVRAPFDAVVAEVYAVPGRSVISAGGDLVTLLDVTSVRVRVRLGGAVAKRAALGTKVAVRAGETVRAAVVTELEPRLDGKGRRQAWIALPNDDGLLLPGAQLEVVLQDG